MEKDKKVIPQNTPYCYSGSRAPGDESYKPCPYWSWVSDEGNGEAHCSYLDKTDGDRGLDLLWDQVKDSECPSSHTRPAMKRFLAGRKKKKKV